MDVFQEAEMLRKVPFFGGLDPAKLKLLAFTSRAVRFGPGENLMSRGEPPDSVYVIIEGEVEILGETPAGEFIVAVVGPQRAAGRNGRHHEYAARRHRARAGRPCARCASPRMSSCACSRKIPAAHCT